MSFPKAKIHRFNDEISCAPPPGTYDPKFDQKIKGAVIEKGHRFRLENASSMESLDSLCSSSTAQQSLFRTPTMMRKKPVATPRSAAVGGSSLNAMFPTKIPVSEPKVKKKLNYLFNKSDNEQKLVEQIDELARVHTTQLLEKDQEISALHGEIDSLKEQIKQLDSANSLKENAIRSEYETIIDEFKRDVERFQNVLADEKEARQKSIDRLYCQVASLELNLKESAAVDSALRRAKAENQECLQEMDHKYLTLEAKVLEAKQEMDRLMVDHEKELESITRIHDEGLKEIVRETETGVYNLSTKLQLDLCHLEKEFDIVKMELQTGFRQKIDIVIQETERKASDMETYIAAVSFKVKDMEEEFGHRIADFEKGLQKCRERNENVLNEYKKTLEESESQKAVILEQKITIVELQEKIDRSQEELQQMRKKCRKYEIVHSEITKTVQVLSKRLFESETDVENLNRQQKEMKLKCSLLEKKVKKLIEADKAARANMEELQMAIVMDVKEMEDQLLAKVDTYRRVAAEEAHKMKRNVEEKQKAVEMLASEVDFYRGKANESVQVISRLQTKLSECSQELKGVHAQVAQAQEEMSEKLNAQKALYESLKQDYDSLKSSAECEANELGKRIHDLEAEITSWQQTHERDQIRINELETLGREQTARLEATETDLKTKKDENSDLRNLVQAIERRFAESEESTKEITEKMEILLKEREEKVERIVKLEEEAAEKEMRMESSASELRENRAYADQVTEHLVAVMNELAEVGRRAEGFQRELELKNLTTVQVSEEYDVLRRLYEAQLKRADDLEMDNQKYVDELISELVLEKERCAELADNVEQLKNTLEDRYAEAARVDQEKRALEQALGELQHLNKSRADKEEELKLLMNSAQEDIDRLQQSFDQKEVEVAELNDDKRHLQKELARLEKSIADKEQNMTLLMRTAQEDVDRLQKTLEQKEIQLAQYEEVNRQLLEDIGKDDELKLEIKSAQEYANLLLENLNHKNAELTQLCDDKRRLLDELARSRESMVGKEEELKLTMRLAQEDTNRLQESLEQKEILVRELNEDKQFLLEELARFETSMADKEDEVSRAKWEAENLEGRVNQLQARLSDAERALESAEEVKRGLESRLEDTVAELGRVNENLKNQEAALTDEMKKDVASLKLINADLCDRNEKLKLQTSMDSATIDSLKSTVQELESRKSELESIIGPFRSQLMQYEEERVRLLSKTQYTEKELRELELKHAKSMGHHNNKQKIRHVINLTVTIAEQRKELDKLRTENYQLRQKLGMSHAGGSSKQQVKAQLQLQSIVDKENPVAVNSNSLSTATSNNSNGSVVLPPIKIKPERHLSPASVLKQRNGN